MDLTAIGGRPLELTTVATSSATFHDAAEAVVVNGLSPDSTYEERGIAFTTLRLPAGHLRCRLATVNDVHFGETEAGRVSAEDRGPIVRPAADEPPYPETMNRAAVAEMLRSERVDNVFSAVVVKGDLTADGTAEQFADFEDCYRPPFGERLFVVRGNHDCISGQDAYAGDQWIELPGVSVALIDTALPGHAHGAVSEDQIDWLDSLADVSIEPVVVMGHHPQYLAAGGDDPDFSLTPPSSAALDDLFKRRDAIVAYAAGHTHRHRVQRAGGGIPSIEVGCVKDFPGTWAEYQVYDGGILQIVHRISAPEALAWSERCRGLYADFGVDYTTYALGRLEDRCFFIGWR